MSQKNVNPLQEASIISTDDSGESEAMKCRASIRQMEKRFRILKFPKPPACTL